VIAGRYTLEAEIGRGGMGAVWRGRDEVLGRIVALKKIGVAPGGITPDALRAEREAKLAAKLNHANVVAVFDLVSEVDEDGQSQQYLVMEYVEGTNLSELVRDNGRLDPDQAAPILAQTASALAAAHSAGIVHRDVKPSNILVTPHGQVKLSDFGIARTAADPALTQTGLVTGSPAYLSPEVASGQQATPASDVWSWGATLFHALEGRPPYQVGDNLLGALYRIVHEEPPRPEAAGWLTPVLEATMTRDPAERWSIASAQQFLEVGPHPQPLAPVPTPRRTPAVRSTSYVDDGTQVMPAAAATASPPPPATPAEPMFAAPPDAAPARRRPWLLVVALAVAVVVAMLVAFQIGLGDDHNGGDDTAQGPSASNEPSPSESQSAEPSAQDMESFVATYIDTVVSDPESAFEMLTPKFQAESGGLQGYLDFWGDVRSAKIDSIEADPEALTVSYSYQYVKPQDGPTDDDVTLQLTHDNGVYLIDGET
jgi:serine/threonine protein kinase